MHVHVLTSFCKLLSVTRITKLLYCTALHCTALHCTALHCTALHCTALHCTALYCIVLRSILQKHGGQWSFLYFYFCKLQGEQGWRCGESIHLQPVWTVFESRTRRQMWVEFVVGSRPCSQRFFTGYSGFPFSSKTNISKFQFDLDTGDDKDLKGRKTLSV